jgi:hypothetical protein
MGTYAHKQSANPPPVIRESVLNQRALINDGGIRPGAIRVPWRPRQLLLAAVDADAWDKKKGGEKG